MGIFDRIKLEKSVKRTKQWWDALTSDERSFVVCVENYPKHYSNKPLADIDVHHCVVCAQCWSCLPNAQCGSCLPTKKSTPYDRGLCSGCAEKYNQMILKANKYVELLNN